MFTFYQKQKFLNFLTKNKKLGVEGLAGGDENLIINFYWPLIREFCQNGANGIANSENLIRLLLLEQSDLGLHCLPRPICS